MAKHFWGSPLVVGHTVVLAVLWVVWKSRNKMVFDAVQLSTRGIVVLISEHAVLWSYCATRGQFLILTFFKIYF
jgi:hypothetical protein